MDIQNFFYLNFGRIPPLLSERSELKWGMNADFLLKALTISKIYAIIDTQEIS